MMFRGLPVKGSISVILKSHLSGQAEEVQDKEGKLGRC